MTSWRFGLSLILGLAAVGCQLPNWPPSSAVEVLTFRTPTTDRVTILRANEIHEYEIGHLSARDAFRGVVEQRGVDLVIQLTDSHGVVVTENDSPTGSYGFEHFCFIAENQEKIRLRLAAVQVGDSGTYRLFLRQPRPATSADRACAEAIRAFSEVEGRRQQTTETTLENLALAYERAISLFREAAIPYPLAITLKQAGSNLSQLGDLNGSLSFYSEAITILRGRGTQPKDPRQLAAVLNLAGLSRELLGQPEPAKAAFEEALALSRKSDDPRGEAASLSNLALWERTGGDLHRAVDLLREALVIWRQLGEAEDEAKTLRVLGTITTQLGLFNESLDILHQALAITKQGGRPHALAKTWMFIGWAEQHANRHKIAARHLFTAVRLYREAGDRLGEAAALGRLGTAYESLGRRSASEAAFRMSLDAYRTTENHLYTAHAATSLGCLLGVSRKEGPRLEARKLLDEALATFSAIGDRATLAHVHFCLAKSDSVAGNPDGALRQIELSQGLVSSLRAVALRRGHHGPILGLWREYSELHVDLLVDSNQDALAFALSDLDQARRLAEMLEESRIDLRTGVPGGLLNRERSIQHRLNEVELRRRAAMEAQLRQGPIGEVTAADIVDMNKTLRVLLRHLTDVRAAIRSASPQYAELREPSAVRVRELQELLTEDTLLLSYALGDLRSFLFVVSSNEIESHILPGRRQIDRLARRVYEGLRNSDQRRTQRQLPADCQRLSRILCLFRPKRSPIPVQSDHPRACGRVGMSSGCQ